MHWTQIYDPFGHWWLSTLVAALPLLVLFGLLAGLKVKPHLCAIAGALTAAVVAVVFFGMPVTLAAMSFGYGVAFGLLKIAWIVLAAVFLYDISVATGQFEIMKESVAGITPDRRLQVLLVAFCFGAFIEGAAGFGAPVAIAGAFMIGLGFRPFHAAALNLIANTAPVAWGAIGTPVHTLAAVCGLPESDLNAMIGRILPFTAVIVPFWLVRTMVGWSETFEVLPAILVVGLSFGFTQFFWSNHVDSNLVDIAAGAVSIVATVAFLHFWKPKKIWRFDYDKKETPLPPPTASIADQAGGEWAAKEFDGYGKSNDDSDNKNNSARSYPVGQVLKAWMPFAILSLFVLLWGLPKIKLAINQATTPAFKVVLPDGKVRPGPPGWDVPLLHNAVYRAAPVVTNPTPEAARYDFNWLSATGTGCFLAAILSGLLLGMSPGRLAKTFWRTLVRMRLAVIAISFMLGLGYVTRYSGLDAVLGLAFTRTGWAYPFFGTFLGWLGVALTGSDTSSNTLFGSLQRITSQQLGIDPVLMCAANSAGGVMGKMVDAQSITIATAATEQVGNEGAIFRFVVWHSVALGAIVGVIVMLYAYVFSNAVPHGLTFVKCAQPDTWVTDRTGHIGYTFSLFKREEVMPWKECSVMDERLQFVARRLAGEAMADLCREFGISRKTGYKIFDRYQECGVEGLTDRSRRPYRYANQLPFQVENYILNVKREHTSWGARKIRERLLRRFSDIPIPAKSTIHAVLDRHGLVERRGRLRHRAQGTPLSLGQRPNELWCTDYKGEFLLGNHLYCYPLTVTDHASRYLLTCEALSSTKEDYAFTIFERLFKERGLPAQIRSDNGVPFASAHALFNLSKLAVWWLRLGIGIERIKPGNPQQNGRHERMHLTLKKEATKPASANFLQQQARFDKFIEVFNNERPHEALGMKYPAEIYQPSTRLYQGLPDIDYPLHDKTIVVTRCGRICLGAKKINFSQVFAGQAVGIKEVHDDIWLVTFMDYDLGYFDLETRVLEPLENPFGPKVLPM